MRISPLTYGHQICFIIFALLHCLILFPNRLRWTPDSNVLTFIEVSKHWKHAMHPKIRWSLYSPVLHIIEHINLFWYMHMVLFIVRNYFWRFNDAKIVASLNHLIKFIDYLLNNIASLYIFICLLSQKFWHLNDAGTSRL